MDEQKEQDNETSEQHISPGVLAIIAVISVGGLLLLGVLSGGMTGNVTYKAPYSACCTVLPWSTFAQGYRQGSEVTSTVMCDPFEMPQRCCLRAGVNQFKSPVRLMDSRVGVCTAPELNYPTGGVYSSDSYKACCTVQAIKSAPSGYIQGEVSTFTNTCSFTDDLFSCCASAGSGLLGGSVKVVGAKDGDCSPPEVNYPMPYNGYTACCRGSSWSQASTGYFQGEQRSATAYCESSETLSQCCARYLSKDGVPVRLDGYKLGSCSAQINYPLWMR